MRNLQWVVQSNLNSVGADLIEKACRELNIKYTPVQIIPFSDTLPDYDKSIPAIFYGSTTMGRLVRGERGFFMNDNFTFESYLTNWKNHLLNPGFVRTIRDVMKHTYFTSKEDEIFIRPNDDSKCFSGQVIKVKDMWKWFDGLQRSDGEELTMDTKILIADPEDIQKEWRLWIVKGKVVAASHYKAYDKLSKEEGCPDYVTNFAEEVCKKWTPHNVFCMDVCTLYNIEPHIRIIECGCFNSCGFYAADVNNIVKEVTNYYERSNT